MRVRQKRTEGKLIMKPPCVLNYPEFLMIGQFCGPDQDQLESPRMRQTQVLGIAMMLLSSGCSEQQRPPSDSLTNSTDTGTTFVLSSSDKSEKEALAIAGDADAAMSLARHYGMAGGDNGRTGDPQNSIEEDRWLRVAVANGYEPARLRLATKVLLDNDCAEGRELLKSIAEGSADAETQKGARDWLNSEEAACSS